MGHFGKHLYHPHRGNRKLNLAVSIRFTTLGKNFSQPPPSRNFLYWRVWSFLEEPTVNFSNVQPSSLLVISLKILKSDLCFAALNPIPPILEQQNEGLISGLLVIESTQMPLYKLWLIIWDISDMYDRTTMHSFHKHFYWLTDHFTNTG